MVATKIAIIPAPGYILCLPYIPDKVFKAAKETAGEDQMSVIVKIGKDIKDDHGFMRSPSCLEKDIIIHAASNKTFEIDFTQYRIVHFTEVHGVYIT